MIKLIKSGKYILGETKDDTRMLVLDKANKFAWIKAKDIGDILVLTNRKPPFKNTFAEGNFRLYEVKDEKKLTDLEHLELFIGDGNWQGYLLPTGLPTKDDIRNRIIPTDETITVTAF